MMLIVNDMRLQPSLSEKNCQFENDICLYVQNKITIEILGTHTQKKDANITLDRKVFIIKFIIFN